MEDINSRKMFHLWFWAFVFGKHSVIQYIFLAFSCTLIFEYSRWLQLRCSDQWIIKLNYWAEYLPPDCATLPHKYLIHIVISAAGGGRVAAVILILQTVRGPGLSRHAAVRHSRLVLHLSLFRQTKNLLPSWEIDLLLIEDFPLGFHITINPFAFCYSSAVNKLSLDTSPWLNSKSHLHMSCIASYHI